MTLAATLLLSLAPQIFPGKDLKLPPKKPSVAEATEVRPLKEIERFRRDLVEMGGPKVKVEAKLEEMGRAYPKIEDLILEVARTARATEMRHLMPVARRFGRVSGTDRVGDELLFQLLARSCGAATRSVIETMAVLKGPNSKDALKQCMRASISAVRRQAIPVLGPMCTVDDFGFVVALSREQSLDLRIRAVDLLRAIGDAPASARLVELLSKDPALAAAACLALIRIGPNAIETLQKRVLAPSVDRSFVYAAFALAQIGEQTGQAVLPGELLKPLARRLKAPEALTRVLAAVPLADLIYRAAPAEGAQLPDVGLVEALLLVVEPTAFVPNLDMLRNPAEQRLLRHTGRMMVGAKTMSWRNWWRVQKNTFLGVRSSITVDASNAGGAVVTLRQEDRTVRMLGEDVAGASPIAGTIEVLLTSEQLLDLVRSLEDEGYGDPLAMRVDSALPRVRSLEIRVSGGRSSVAVTESAHLGFDAMAQSINALVDRELWQMYRVGSEQPNRHAFWVAEQAWRSEHKSPVARAQRMLEHVVRGWSTWDKEMQLRAIGFLVGHPSRREIVRTQDGAAIVAALQQLPALADADIQLLEIAAGAPGDKVWRDCLALAISMDGGGREAVRKVFNVLGPDAVLSALKDERTLVRRAAVDEVISVRDPRAGPLLVQLLLDDDYDVQRAAVFACGHLRVAVASRPLIDMIAAKETDPELRRDCMRSLGRVGGGLAFSVLQQSMGSPNKDDKEAAMRGLGELRDPRAAHLLAELTVLGHGKELGRLAKFHLQRQGASLAVPALRSQIPLAKDEQIRAELVLLLAIYQDPKNVPDLMDLLRTPQYAAKTVDLLEGATGVDLKSVTDRVSVIEGWWQINKDLAQWQWLLEELRANEVPTTLKFDDFSSSAEMSAVPELARLMVEVKQPRLWVLCSAVIRTVSGEDYGVVNEQTPVDVREGLAGRFLVAAEEARAEKK